MCRVTNLLGPSPIPVETITFQYWFDGPTVEEPNTSPDELFTVVCNDATPGVASTLSLSDVSGVHKFEIPPHFAGDVDVYT